MRKKNVVYTAITDGYDDLIDPIVVSNNCDYVCYTDNLNISTNVWKLRSFPEDLPSGSLKNRYVKLLPHKLFSEYENSLYIDGNIKIVGDIDELFNKLDSTTSKKIMFFKHPDRNCIYQEAKACTYARKESPDVINEQMNKYKKMQYPQDNGLIHGCVILRKHNEAEIITLSEDWWKELITESKRDQLSFNVMAWKNNINYGLIEGTVFNNIYFKSLHHKNSKLNIKGKIMFLLTSRFGGKISRFVNKYYLRYKSLRNDK